MDEFEDENLKQIFGKLRNGSTSERGIEWDILEKDLPPISTRRAWIVSTVLLLLVGLGIWFGMFQTQQEGLAEKTKQSTRQSRPMYQQKADQGKDRNDNKSATKQEVVITDLDAKRVSPQKSLVAQVHAFADTKQTHVQNARNKLIEDVAEPTPTSVVESDLTKPGPMADSFAVEVPPKEKARRVLHFSAGAGYMFGFVTPNLTDRLLVKGYQSKPGVVVRVQGDFPLLSTKAYSIRGAAFTSVVYKPFLFDVMAYRPEKIDSYAVRETVVQPQIGLGLLWTPTKHHHWDVQAGVSISVANSKSDLLSNRWLLVSMNREIIPVGEKLAIAGGVEMMMPLQPTSEYFRYLPFQILVALRTRR